MGLKYHTIILVPHSRAKFRKWRVSQRLLFSALAAFLAVTGGALFVTWSYFTTPFSLDDLERLRSENDHLRDQERSYEENVRALQQQLAEYEDRTQQLAIVAGLDGLPNAQSRYPDAGPGAGGSHLAEGHATRYDLELLESRTEQLDDQLDAVADELEKTRRLIAATPSIMPVFGIFTSPYGYRKDPITGRRAFHNGVDISAQPGKPVFATADGIVTRAGRIGDLGRAVYVVHGYGISTRYGHLSKISVEPGDRVKRGDLLGYVGNSGRATGYHLHYEIREDNRATNPLAYILDGPKRHRS